MKTQYSFIKTVKLLDWRPFNTSQIVIALIGNILDFVITRRVLLPNYFSLEGNLFGNIPWLSISVTVTIMLCIQLMKVYFNTIGDRKALLVSKIASWILTVMPYVVIINNIMFIYIFDLSSS